MFCFFSSLRAGHDRLVQVVDCAAAMDSQGSSSVTPLQTVNMLMHSFPRFRHFSLSVLLANTKIQPATPCSHKHNYRQIPSLLLLLLTSFMPKPTVPELSMAPFSEGKIHTFFCLTSLWLDAGSALPRCRQVSGTSLRAAV